MPVIISSDSDSVVELPGASVVWTVKASSETGEPISGLPLVVSATGSISILQEKFETDNQGIARIELTTGTKSGHGILDVVCKETKWQGRFYVTKVVVTVPPGLLLSTTDENLLRMLFWDKQEVLVIRQFGGGQSGNRVFQVKASDAQGTFLTQIVKLGIRDEILQEGENYELFRDRVAGAAPICGVAQSGVHAAIIYGDAAAASRLAPVITLSEYFLSRSYGSSALQSILHSLLGVGLRGVYRSYQVRNCSARGIVGRWLPENVVVSLGTTMPGAGVFPAGQGRIPDGAIELNPHQIEYADGRHSELNPGDAVFLRGFRVSKVQAGDLNLEDQNGSRYRVKVRFDGLPVTGVSPEQMVDVAGRFVTDRNTRFEFAIHHCLEMNGFDLRPAGGYCIGPENYPAPTPLLSRVLDIDRDTAWATIHGDLHWENVMAEGPENWWLIDYGLTRKGAVLYDFAKLEVYLRMMVLPADPEITPKDLLLLEQDLLNNPYGHLPSKKYPQKNLEKAAAAIQLIRRLAEPYMLGSYSGYRDLVFCYALAVTKYYPTEDAWQNAAHDPHALSKLQKISRRICFALTTALTLGRAIESEQVLREFPNLNLAFEPFGVVLEPKEGRIVLDVGSQLQNCMIDHHQLKGGNLIATAGLVWEKRELIENCNAARNLEDAMWVLHEHPDFDAISSLFLAWHLAKCGFFPPGGEQLHAYALRVDMGEEMLEESADPTRTPYALFQAMLATVPAVKDDDRERVRKAWQLVKYFCQSEASGQHVLAMNQCPQEHGFWELEQYYRNDEEVFLREDVAMADDKQTQVQLCLAEGVKTVRMLAVKSPRSLLFKVWARRNGYPLTVVFWPPGKRPDPFVVISVPAAYREALKGLGFALEMEEKRKRLTILPGKERLGPPRWPDGDNNDPWYDGRSAAHGYTIVASPRVGTVLTMVEILHIVKDTKWQICALSQARN